MFICKKKQEKNQMVGDKLGMFLGMSVVKIMFWEYGCKCGGGGGGGCKSECDGKVQLCEPFRHIFTFLFLNLYSPLIST